jgi:hypothetical protein
VDQGDLVERASEGDHDAFAQLVGASIAHMEAVARLILRDRELARVAVIVDPNGGSRRQPSWIAGGAETWQRVAP